MMYCLALLLMMLIYCCYAARSSTTDRSVLKDLHKRNFTYGDYDGKISLLEVEGNGSNETGMVANARVKRQLSSGAGKFTEAAQLPQLKLLRLFLTMFKNLWATSYTGGSNPFHHSVPKPTVMLFKQRIVEFFFPDIGEEAIKKKYA